jgi:phosphonate transport system substrate-binding protein
MVKWETAPLVNNAVMARDDLPPPLVAQLRTTLLELDQTAAGKAILAHMEIARFLPATDASYEVVRQYVAHFERAIRPVEQP